MNKSIQLVTLPTGLCAIHIENDMGIKIFTMKSEQDAYEYILNDFQLCAMALENPMLDAMLTNLIAEI
jgi:hypothetical protein